MAFKPRPPNENDPIPDNNDIIVGDLHGDKTALDNLLTEVNYNPANQRLFALGDLVDRGNDSKGILDFFHEPKNNAHTIMGNHDFWHIRNAQHMQNELATGVKNPMKSKPSYEDTVAQLGDKYFQYAEKMKDAPLWLPFKDRQGSGHLVHASVTPHGPIEKQPQSQVLMGRHFPTPGVFMMHETPEHPFWHRSYQGHLGDIIHGHHVTMDHKSYGHPNIFSMDGGSVYGKNPERNSPGVLRAMRLGDRKIFEVPGGAESIKHYHSLQDPSPGHNA